MGNSDVVAAFGNTYVFYGKAAFYPAETSTWNPMERFAGKGSGNRRNLSIFSARDSVGGDDWNWKYHRDPRRSRLEDRERFSGAGSQVS